MEARERGKAQRQREEEARREEARVEESQSQEEGHTEKEPRRKRSDTETEAGRGEAGTSQSCNKKGQMTNTYLTRSDEEAIVDFVKAHEGLYNKITEHFKDKARKECLLQRFTNSHKLSVMVCKTWFE